MRPFHDTADVNGGGPHGQANAAADIDGGKLDGFVTQAEQMFEPNASWSIYMDLIFPATDVVAV